MSLSVVEQDIFITKVNHCLRNDDGLFEMGRMIIGLGERRGLFNGVAIGNEEVRNAMIEQLANVDV
jgi:hypothetical protein